MIVLSESTEQIEASASASENKLMTEAAQLLGCKVYYIPRDFERCATAENALWHIPNYPQATAGIWIGYIPEFERYKAIYHAALAKGIKLLNTPLEHQTALEFDLFYPHLKGLTPKSLVITSTNECIEAGELLGFPVFVKGAVQSRKRQGWESCVANNQEELVRLTEWLLKLKYGSRGRVIVRKLVKLWHKRLAPNRFPMGAMSTTGYAGALLKLSHSAESAIAKFFIWEWHSKQRLKPDVYIAQITALSTKE